MTFFTDCVIALHTAESVLSASDIQVLEENDSSCDGRPRDNDPDVFIIQVSL